MYDPIIYHFRRAYPAATVSAEIRFAPSVGLRCATAQHYLADAAFDLAYCCHDGADTFIAILEIHAHEHLHFPVECSYHDLHGCYVCKGEVVARNAAGATLELHGGQYALLYAPRAEYRVEIPQGITIMQLWSTNDRMLVREHAEHTLKPLRTLLHQWVTRAPRCHHSRVLPYAGECEKVWIQLRALPMLRPLTLCNRVREAVAELIYGCIDALLESGQGQRRSLELIRAVRADILSSLRLGVVLRVNGLAQRHAVSAKHLRRLHLHYYGTPLKVFITHLRLKHGRSLLTEAGCTVREAAYATGYGSEWEFKQAFKKQFGCWPADRRSASH